VKGVARGLTTAPKWRRKQGERIDGLLTKAETDKVKTDGVRGTNHFGSRFNLEGRVKGVFVSPEYIRGGNEGK